MPVRISTTAERRAYDNPQYLTRSAIRRVLRLNTSSSYCLGKQIANDYFPQDLVILPCPGTIACNYGIGDPVFLYDCESSMYPVHSLQVCRPVSVSPCLEQP
ncbi:hypothetical protein TNCV_4608851 [Trichonephila clavipes]|nr:hypothetical protein TNCV_4608851 [Trichonephila clavipes]